MDWGSIAGLVLAIAGIVIGQSIEGGHISSLLQPAALMIVLSGTMGAVLIQNNIKVFFMGLWMLRLAFFIPADDKPALSKKLVMWSHLARKDGIFVLEDYIKKESDPFMKKGLRLMVDGTPPEKIREIIAIDLYFFEAERRKAVKIWEAAGGYAPTIGILGAVLGLIHVMENLSDPTKLGGGIAVAFVATIYGVGLANLVFLPIANKLKNHVVEEAKRREMLLNAWVSIANGDHPRVTEERLYSYLEDHQVFVETPQPPPLKVIKK